MGFLKSARNALLCFGPLHVFVFDDQNGFAASRTAPMQCLCRIFGAAASYLALGSRIWRRVVRSASRSASIPPVDGVAVKRGVLETAVVFVVVVVVVRAAHDAATEGSASTSSLIYHFIFSLLSQIFIDVFCHFCRNYNRRLPSFIFM